MQFIIVLIIIFLSFVISFESSFIYESYGEKDLVIDEKVHITISKDNETLIVPAKIGIDPKLWKDHSLDYYSFDPNANHNTSPLNTKNYNGTIYMESIYDREFTLQNFLDVWGFDKTKIKNIFCSEKQLCDLDLTLTDGQNLTLELKSDKTPDNFTKYIHPKITFEYPSQWKITNSILGNETFYDDLIKVFPKEAEYMTTPFFSIQIKKLDSNMTTLDEYYMNNLPDLLQADENTFPHFIHYNKTEIDGNLAYLILLDTTLVAEPGSPEKGNEITQKESHIWTIKGGYFYDISYKALNGLYNDYWSMQKKIINSIRIQ